MIPESDKDIEVEILDESIDEEVDWVKYSTTYDGKSGIFKLVKENDVWKVTSKSPREKDLFEGNTELFQSILILPLIFFAINDI
jgi:hypothetical protein